MLLLFRKWLIICDWFLPSKLFLKLCIKSQQVGIKVQNLTWNKPNKLIGAKAVP